MVSVRDSLPTGVSLPSSKMLVVFCGTSNVATAVGIGVSGVGTSVSSVGIANSASRVGAIWGRLVGVTVGLVVWVGTGVGVVVLPIVGLELGVYVASIVGAAVGGSGVWVGMAADKARVGSAGWALVAAERCQKTIPVLTMTSKTRIMKAIRKTDRDVFTLIPIQIIIFRRRGVRCG